MGKHVTLSRIMLVAAFALLGLGGYARAADHPVDPLANAEVVGSKAGAEYRALVSNAAPNALPESGTTVKRVVYFTGSTTMVGANTPISSSSYCSFAGKTVFRADAYLTGTMTGTNPTVAIKWQHSLDGGVTWVDAGTWTTINATVTPASQSQTVMDDYDPAAPVLFGDCWRSTLTFTGTGTVTANLRVVGFAK